MNFYYNYFASIGRESKVIIHYTLYTFLQCVFPEKVDFPTEFVDSFLRKLRNSFPPPCSARIKRTYHCSRFVRRSTMHYRLGK